MGSVETWSTKEEVLKDLAKASGRRIRKKEDLDEGYLVIGDAPPPMILEDEDDEMMLLFGEAVTKKGVPAEDVSPDLRGIQEMLRMVQEYNDGEDESTTNDLPNQDCVIAISKVSKLNPNVKEFIPRSTSSVSSSGSQKIYDKANLNVVTQTNDVNIEDSSKKDFDVDLNCNDINVNVQNVKPNEYQDIATKLKNTISEAAKSDSFELKKQKNVAIQTLLRLYANTNKSPNKNPEPIKLITPEYFEGKKDENVVPKVERVSSTPQTISSETSTPTPEPKTSCTTIPTCSSNSISSTPLQTLSESNLLENNRKIKTPEKKLDPEIKRSIEKVNKWLDEPTKRKSPAVCLGPIAFKRKDAISPRSPVSQPEQQEQQSQCSGSGQQYIPSNFAADLGRKYMERNKAKEDRKKDVTWSNLDEVLKQKDLVIKKRLEEQASTSESNDDSAPQR